MASSWATFQKRRQMSWNFSAENFFSHVATSNRVVMVPSVMHKYEWNGEYVNLLYVVTLVILVLTISLTTECICFFGVIHTQSLV